MSVTDVIVIAAGFLGLFLLMGILYPDPTCQNPKRTACPSVITSNEPVKIAVVKFDDYSGMWGRLIDQFGWDVKESMRTMLETALQRKPNLRVYARGRLSDLVVEEQLFGNIEGYVDPETAVKIGEMSGVQYLVTGTITDYATRTLPFIPVVTPTASLFFVDFRVIDTTTGEIAIANACNGISMGGGLGKLDLGTIQRAVRSTANKIADAIDHCIFVGY